MATKPPTSKHLRFWKNLCLSMCEYIYLDIYMPISISILFWCWISSDLLDSFGGYLRYLGRLADHLYPYRSIYIHNMGLFLVAWKGINYVAVSTPKVDKMDCYFLLKIYTWPIDMHITQWYTYTQREREIDLSENKLSP